MSETKVEKVIGRIKRICCDWGLAKPTVPKFGAFYGNSAPMWRCPSPILLLICGVFHLVAFIALLIVVVIIEDFGGGCSGEITDIRNLGIFLFLINGIYQFYMSRSDMGTDKQWCRYITLSTILESILLILALALGFLIVGGCESLNLTSYNVALACSLIGIISAGIFTAIIVYTIVKLYCVGNPIAYNLET